MSNFCYSCACKDLNKEQISEHKDSNQKNLMQNLLELYAKRQRLSDGQILILRTTFSGGSNCIKLKCKETYRMIMEAYTGLLFSGVYPLNSLSD